MSVVTKQQLENARLDTVTLEAVVNGAATPGTVTSRLGTNLLTLAKVIQNLSSVDIGESAAAEINRTIELSKFKAAAATLNATELSEVEFEALDFYDLDKYYSVEGLGIYKGRNLIVQPHFPAPTANDLYVATTGNNANDGLTPATPKQTILAAFNTISATGGKTIWVYGGNYTDAMTMTNKSFTLPVVIRAVPGHIVNITPSSGTTSVYFVGACENIKFRNINFYTIATTSQLVVIQSRASNCGLYDCSFIDANTKPFSMALSGTGGTNGFEVKRSLFVSSGNFTINASSSTNLVLIGNDMSQIVGNIQMTGGAVGGIYKANQNIANGIVLTGGTGVALIAEVKHNDCRFITHTGGTGTYKSVLTIENNTINSATLGISITGYTVGGTGKNNQVVAAGTVGIAWPDVTAISDCSNHAITGNDVIVTGANTIGLLVGAGSSTATISGNCINASLARQGVVITGSTHTVNSNIVNGGSLNSLLLKGCTSCSITGNTIVNGVVDSVALQFAPDLANPSSNTVTGNTFTISNGRLYSQLLADIGSGNVVNSNTYQITEQGIWGALLGSLVNSIVDVRSQWSSQYASSPTNDNTSTSA